MRIKRVNRIPSQDHNACTKVEIHFVDRPVWVHRVKVVRCPIICSGTVGPSLLFLMIIHDSRKNHEQVHNLVCLFIIILGQIGYATMLSSSIWQRFVSLVL